MISWGWLVLTRGAASGVLNAVFVFLWLVVVFLLRFRRGSNWLAGRYWFR